LARACTRAAKERDSPAGLKQKLDDAVKRITSGEVAIPRS
jgi:hypothetical protein